jgi:hypothetical protein
MIFKNSNLGIRRFNIQNSRKQKSRIQYLNKPNCSKS